MFNPENIVYYIIGDSVECFWEIDGYLIPHTKNVFSVKEFSLKNKFDSKLDAMYELLIHKLSNGTPLRNFKVSPYYSYYIERLKEENPEFLI